MSTVYVFDQEIAALVTVASGDKLLIHDVSAGTKKVITVGNLLAGGIDLTGGAQIGDAAADTVGFYGATRVNQGTMTATALTAIGTTTISAANTSTVFGFASSTAATALVTRVRQMQADLETLMARVDSTGLVAIAGVP